MILPVGSFSDDARLGLKMRNSTEITPITGTAGAASVTYSPDGEWIAYVVGRDIFERPLFGGAPVKLAGDAFGRGGATPVEWLDDGTILYSQIFADATHTRAGAGRFEARADIRRWW